MTLRVNAECDFSNMYMRRCVDDSVHSTNTHTHAHNLVDECNAEYCINLHQHSLRNGGITLCMSFFLTLSHYTHSATDEMKLSSKVFFFFPFFNSNDLIGSARVEAMVTATVAVAEAPSTCRKDK